jgi:hypothetical protein
VSGTSFSPATAWRPAEWFLVCNSLHRCCLHQWLAMVTDALICCRVQQLPIVCAVVLKASDVAPTLLLMLTSLSLSQGCAWSGGQQHLVGIPVASIHNWQRGYVACLSRLLHCMLWLLPALQAAGHQSGSSQGQTEITWWWLPTAQSQCQVITCYTEIHTCNHI